MLRRHIAFGCTNYALSWYAHWGVRKTCSLFVFFLNFVPCNQNRNAVWWAHHKFGFQNETETTRGFWWSGESPWILWLLRNTGSVYFMKLNFGSILMDTASLLCVQTATYTRQWSFVKWNIGPKRILLPYWALQMPVIARSGRRLPLALLLWCLTQAGIDRKRKPVP